MLLLAMAATPMSWLSDIALAFGLETWSGSCRPGARSAWVDEIRCCSGRRPTASLLDTARLQRLIFGIALVGGWSTVQSGTAVRLIRLSLAAGCVLEGGLEAKAGAGPRAEVEAFLVAGWHKGQPAKLSIPMSCKALFSYTHLLCNLTIYRFGRGRRLGWERIIRDLRGPDP